MFSEIPNETTACCERLTNDDAILLYGLSLYFGWYQRQQHNLPNCKTGSTLKRQILKIGVKMNFVYINEYLYVIYIYYKSKKVTPFN